MMTSFQQAATAYRVAATQVHPLVAVVKLYDEALRRIARAVEDSRAKRMEDAFINISHACAILRGLSANLNFARGSDVAEALKQAYLQNMIALHSAFGKRDAPERYARIIAGLTELRDSWAIVAGMKTTVDMKAESLPQQSLGIE